MSRHSWLAFRVGIAPRLTVAFLAVAVLAIAANSLIETGPPIIQIVDVHPKQSGMGSPRRIAPPSIGPLLAAITRFGHVLGTRLADASPARVTEANQASEALAREGTDYLRRARAAGNAPNLHKLEASLKSHRTDAARIIATADERRQRIKEDELHFEDLDVRMKGAVDRAWKIFGRVVARQFMIDMTRTLDRIRPDLAMLVSTGAHNQLPIAAIGANEVAFATSLQDNETTLRRTQGWS